ncbi:MAG: DmsE family decaheme c-type cytochrome [Zoogloeaceae bacterium]|jgi:DmsE family decaheme c-type cytochrome|nr:DmsE family decaheme c-type cytochrome [Zoogloeaceae bacterium]
MKAVKNLLALMACCVGVSFAGATLAADDAKDAPQEKKDLILKGDAKCTGCHDEADDPTPSMLELHPSVLSIGKTKHGTQADGRTPTCTDCHGDSDDHMNYKGSGKPPKPSILFTKNSPTPAELRNERCLTCHQGGKRINWQSSTHAGRDVACVSCHNVHARRDKVRDKFAQTDICYSCHKEQRAQMIRPTHHPVPEGKMGCSSCHDVHSDNPKALTKSSTNDTCYTCHMEKRGPFVHEHQPVAEDCGICHKPHGTTTPNLLAQRVPILCQQCHSSSGQAHAQNTAGVQIGGNYNGQGSISGRGCLVCHTAIHGSNLPNGGQHYRR